MTIHTKSLVTPALKNIATPESEKGQDKAWVAAKKFEQTFVSAMLQELLKNNDEGFLGGGQNEIMFRSLWTEKIAESMSFGIAESVYPTLLKSREVES